MCAEPLAAFRISFPIAFPHAPLSRLRCRFASDVCASAPHVLEMGFASFSVSVLVYVEFAGVEV